MGETITQIGRYEISRQLVDTALASVYDAFDPVERKPVAIRVPRTTQTHATGALSVGLKHPGLMTVLSCEENQGEPFMVLEPFEGKPLDQHIPAAQKMDPAEALGLLRQLASALDYAHAHGSIHGSLHPSGILLNDRQQVKVLDLGPNDDTGAEVSPEQLLRAVHFLSPERIRDRVIDGRSDQFSLAVLAHRMLTGKLPFPGTPLGAMFRIAYQGLERDAVRDLPAAAQAVFLQSLAKSPAERYDTCSQMVDALEAALIRRPLAVTRLADASEFIAPRSVAPASVQRPASRHFSREAVKYFGITFAVCALILGAVFYFLLPPKPVAGTGSKVVPVVPGITHPPVQPAPAPTVAPATQAAPPKTPAVTRKAKPAPRGLVKKKVEPEVELKPVEPKIIRR